MATPIRQEPIETVVTTLEEKSKALPEVAQRIIEMRKSYEVQIAELRQQVTQLSLEKQQLSVELNKEKEEAVTFKARYEAEMNMIVQRLNYWKTEWKGT